MVNVAFKGIRTAKCSFCGKDKDEVFDVGFADRSISGAFCKNCLLRLVRMQIGAAPTGAPAKSPTNNVAAAETK